MNGSPWQHRIITVFGGGGFIGRYVCEALFKTGVRVRVAQRTPRNAFFLQPLAAVGQLDLVRADFTRPDSLAAAVEGAWGVINLVGAFDGRLAAIHGEAPGRIAELAASNGVESLVHVSAIGVSADSGSAYARTKAAGEQAVRAAYPRATIIRPSVVFGQEDQFTNRFAGMSRLPVLPVLGARTKFQPIFVRDLGQAVAKAAQDPGRFGGETFELGGPDVMTMHELNRAIATAAGRSPEIIDLPDFVGDAMSRLGFLPGAPLSRDQWIMLQRDNVATGPGLEAFGIQPTPLAAVAPEWLDRFHEGGRFASRRTQVSAD
ncbi:complex I NDUFA9 subunit family protein [Sphingomonas astaxanthinifaciens]|uniref:3-beta-hydroxy-Delta(5)-steroid dehydrogenase n=1 Tax=Sphingomonas astaxanthinifaciens DSM 22298 TaxID=1123267 RepID=A0ABQ5Z3E3_9SPHN|nr:complex I NDUFA9 subunit family protein [Sphingomonas astaxanthinifaciens]GLR47305.1 3-beta-hydroxy-Delta(5)-steroid dehydrogenase [Sphingomonas astaxanthinifaciens DSM 22298]